MRWGALDRACMARRRAFDRIRRKNLYLRAIVWGDVLTRPLDGQEGSASLPLMLRERRLIRHDAARTPVPGAFDRALACKASAEMQRYFR
jgi:hypothetical protein